MSMATDRGSGALRGEEGRSIRKSSMRRKTGRLPAVKARYFCESCGAEVRPSERTCPSCGKTFTAVKCPRCGFEGASRQFARGCPQCGYLNVIPPADAPPDTAPRVSPRASNIKARAFSLPRFGFSRGFYRIAILVLVLLLLALVAVIAFVPSAR